MLLIPAALTALLAGCVPPGEEKESEPSDSAPSDSAPPVETGPTGDSAHTPCDATVDRDGDGVAAVDDVCAVLDCDDGDDTVYPGAPDTAGDGLDADCDGDDDCGLGPPYPRSAELHSAADMELFCTSYRSTEFDLVISGVEDAVDLSSLSCLCGVGRDFTVEDNPSLTSLHGLEGLVGNIPGDVWVASNDALVDTSAFQGVSSVGGSLTIDGTAIDFDFEGLRGLRRAGTVVLASPANGDLSPLQGLELVDYSLSLNSTPAADLSGFRGLRSAVVISLNSNGLSSLAGLDPSVSPEGLDLRGEGSLRNLSGLPAFVSLATHLSVSASSVTSLDGVEFLQTVGDLTLYDVPSLTDISGLGALAEVTESLDIRQSGLATLDGLESLREIGDDLVLIDNADLVDLTALHGVEHIGGTVYIQYNPSLSDEEAWALVDAIGLGNIDGGVAIGNNLE